MWVSKAPCAECLVASPQLHDSKQKITFLRQMESTDYPMCDAPISRLLDTLLPIHGALLGDLPMYDSPALRTRQRYGGMETLEERRRKSESRNW